MCVDGLACLSNLGLELKVEFRRLVEMLNKDLGLWPNGSQHLHPRAHDALGCRSAATAS